MMQNLKNNKKRVVLYLLPSLFLVASIALAVFRGRLLFEKIDNVNGLYTDAGMGNLFGGLALILFVLFFVSRFAVKRFTFTRPVKNDALTVAFASSVCALMMVVILVGDVYDVLKGIRPLGVLLLFEMLFGILSVIYFFYICSKGTNRQIEGSLWFGVLPLCPALYAAVRAITLFMNTSEQINASQRSFVLLTLICVMMFFVSEAEFAVPCGRLDEEAKAKRMSRLSARYYSYGLAVMCLVIVVIVTYSLAQAFWIYDKTSILYNLMDLCFGLYALVRVFSIG